MPSVQLDNGFRVQLKKLPRSIRDVVLESEEK